jgi:hypothetical protein
LFTFPFSLFSLLLAFLCVPLMGQDMGQEESASPEREGEYVAILPLSSEADIETCTLLTEVLRGEVDNLWIYRTRLVDPEVYPEVLGLPPDMPPPAALLDGAAYGLTSEFYADMDVDVWHMQLWLWWEDGTLIYTDELVADDVEEAREYIPAMVQWIFSKISSRVVEVPVLAETREQPDEYRLYAGVRAGGSARFYVLPGAMGGYQDNRFNGAGFEFGLQAGYCFLPGFIIQIETIYTQDKAVFSGQEVADTAGVVSQYTFFRDSYNGMMLMVPLLLKYRVPFGSFMTAFFGGVYGVIPLGDMEYESGRDEGRVSPLGYRPAYVGLLGGLNLGMQTGPGFIFIDLRFGGDLGRTVVEREGGIEYNRMMFSFSLGYEVPLFKINKR